MDDLITIGDDNPIMPNDETLTDVGAASFNLGNSNQFDWERFYEILETQYNLDMQDLGGRLDGRIQRRVRQLRRDGEIT